MSFLATTLSFLTARAPRLIRLISRFGPKPPGAILLEQLTASWISQAISTATKLKIPDAIAHGTTHCADLARELDLNEGALSRLLRSLCGLGILKEEPDKSFSLTARGSLLRTDVAGSMAAIATATGGHWYRTFGELDFSIRDGMPAFDRIYGQPFFRYVRSHDDFGKIFDAAMQGVSSLVNPLVASSYNFSAYSSIVDIAGGTGGQLATILHLHPRLKGLLFDLPSTIARASASIPPQLARRFHVQPGDFFASIPEGRDIYLLKNIIHDWSDGDALKILHNCHAAMPSHGRLLLVEYILEDSNRFEFGKILDLLMLCSLGGRERTLDEYTALLETASLKVVAVHPTLCPVSIIEAAPMSH